MEKQCFKCLKVKPLDCFYKHRKMLDGHLNKCKECAKKDSRKNRKDNLEYYKEYDRKRGNLENRVENREKYQKTDRGKKKVSEAKKRWRLKNKNKINAQLKVRRAVKTGKIDKKSFCEICNSQINIQAHHEDYSKPLDVIWVCSRCHADIHNEKRRIERENGRKN